MDDAAHGHTYDSTSANPNRWRSLSMNLEPLLYLTIVATVASVGVGVWWVVVGAFEGELGGDYLGGVVYDVRGAGAILIALGLLIGPVAIAVLLTLRAYVEERS
jgi:hypothetical protein